MNTANDYSDLIELARSSAIALRIERARLAQVRASAAKKSSKARQRQSANQRYRTEQRFVAKTGPVAGPSANEG